jgi:hypothetical protein
MRFNLMITWTVEWQITCQGFYFSEKQKKEKVLVTPNENGKKMYD